MPFVAIMNYPSMWVQCFIIEISLFRIIILIPSDIQWCRSSHESILPIYRPVLNHSMSSSHGRAYQLCQGNVLYGDTYEQQAELTAFSGDPFMYSSVWEGLISSLSRHFVSIDFQQQLVLRVTPRAPTPITISWFRKTLICSSKFFVGIHTDCMNLKETKIS